MKTIIGLLIVLGTAGQPAWLTNFDEAKAEAGREHKLILLNFSGSDWCAPCIKLKKEVFESEAFAAQAADRLVLVRADFPRQKKNRLSEELTRHNEALAERYNQGGKFPLTLLLDAEGNVLKSWDGYKFASQDKFLAELKDILRTQH